jgi:hypothetical protein
MVEALSTGSISFDKLYTGPEALYFFSLSTPFSLVNVLHRTHQNTSLSPRQIPKRSFVLFIPLSSSVV